MTFHFNFDEDHHPDPLDLSRDYAVDEMIRVVQDKKPPVTKPGVEGGGEVPGLNQAVGGAAGGVSGTTGALGLIPS